MSADTTPVALFDFDGTLTIGDTLMPFLRFVVGKPVYYSKLLMLSPVLAGYLAGVVRNDIAKQIVLRGYLGGFPVDRLLEQGDAFSERVIPRMERPQGMERLAWHQRQGHRCILVSASLDIYLQRWARERGLALALTSSLQVSENGLVQGRLQGANCFGEEKVSRVRQALADTRPEKIYAYGDTRGDMPMLRFADEGYLWSPGQKAFLPV